VGSAPALALFFTSYEVLKHMTAKHNVTIWEKLSNTSSLRTISTWRTSSVDLELNALVVYYGCLLM